MKIKICGTEQVVPDDTDLSGKPWVEVVEGSSDKNCVIRIGDKIVDGKVEYVFAPFFMNGKRYGYFLNTNLSGFRLFDPYLLEDQTRMVTNVSEVNKHSVCNWNFKVIKKKD